MPVASISFSAHPHDSRAVQRGTTQPVLVSDGHRLMQSFRTTATASPRRRRTLSCLAWVASVGVAWGCVATAWGQIADDTDAGVSSTQASSSVETRSDTGSPAPEREQYVPEELKDLDVDESVGRVVPLDVTLRDSDGNLVQLQDYFFKGKPVILNLGYYKCPMLCSLVISGLQESAKKLDWKLGEQYEIVTVSMNACPVSPHEFKTQSSHTLSLT